MTEQQQKSKLIEPTHIEENWTIIHLPNGDKLKAKHVVIGVIKCLMIKTIPCIYRWFPDVWYQLFGANCRLVAERRSKEIIVNITIPPSELEQLAKKYGLHQVILIARTTGDDGAEYCVTYGINKEHSAVAADIGDFLKYKVMGWKK